MMREAGSDIHVAAIARRFHMTLDTISAKPIHALAVTSLDQISFAETFGHLCHDHCDDLHSHLDASSEAGKIACGPGKPGNTCWLTRQNRLPVRYAELNYWSTPPGNRGRDVEQPQKIYVLRKYLGDGIGRTLAAPLLQAASRLAPPIWADVLWRNERAVGFYSSFGLAAIADDTHTIGAKRCLFRPVVRPRP